MEMMAMMAMRFEQTRRGAPPSVDEGVVLVAESVSLFQPLLFLWALCCIPWAQALKLFTGVIASDFDWVKTFVAVAVEEDGPLVESLRVVIGGTFSPLGQTLETDALIRNTGGTFELKTAPITQNFCQKSCSGQFPHCYSEPLDRPYKCLISMEPRHSKTYHSL